MNILEEVKNCPVEWKELGEISQFYSGLTGKTKSDFENGNAKYVTYKNIFNNIQVEFNLLETVQVDKNERQNFIEYGDVLITGSSESKEEVGMSSTVTFVPDEQIYLNSFSFGIRFNEDIELLPEFTKYLFRSIRLRKQIEKTASGVTRYNISKVTFKKIKVPLLPLEIQEKIVQILDKMTEYVTELTSELTSRKKQYSFYRDKLLSFEDEVYQVEWKTLSEIAKDFGRGKSKHRPRNDARLYGGDIPFIQTGDIREAGKWIENYSQTYSAFGVEQSKKWEKGTLCITIAANIAETGLLGFEACFPDSIIGFVANPEFAITEYVYYYLNSIKDYLANKSYGSAQDNLNLSTFSSLKIPVPSLEIQSRIVQVLDNFDTVCNDLNIGLPKEIELRQKQYEYFRDKLLTFVAEGEYTDSTVQYRQDIIRLLNWVFGPIRVELGSICEFVRGNGLQKKDFTQVGRSVIHYGQIYTKYDFTVAHTLSKTSEMVFKKLKKAYPNDLIMATTSENVEDVGKAIVWEGKEEIGISGDSYIIRTNQNSRYLNYWLRSISFQSQKERKVTGTKVVRINSKDMEKFQIVVPSITEQERIVSILDNFNTLTDSLSKGLPKEIELRQKQYEYWREQLLNFTR